MPKTSINKQGDTVVLENKVRSTGQSLMTPPTGNPVFPKERDQLEFRILITVAPDVRHAA